MTQTAKQQAIDPQREAEIAAYLKEHPHFLQRHPELLETLLPPEHESGAASLSFYQLRHSRERIQKLEQQLNRLIAVAKDNEQLLSRMHQLMLDLNNANNPDDFMQRLELLLKERFGVNHFTLILHDNILPALSNPHIRRPAADRSGVLNDIVQQGLAISGRLTQNKSSALFGAEVEVHSAAIAPIEGFGMLAVASDEVDRFAPDASVMFLSLVGASLKHYLNNTAQ